MYPLLKYIYLRSRPWASTRTIKLGVIAFYGLIACGCATSVPLPSMVSYDDVTGSIDKTSPALSATLDGEDWRRAMAALGVALDPQGAGSSVQWDNPQSRVRGAFTPVGPAFPSDDKICRAFVTDIGGSAKAQQLQGVGCRDKSGDWTVGDLKPWKKS